MQAQRELIRFLSDYQEIWHAQFPDLYRRGQWHLTCHLCLRGGRGGIPVAELAGVVKSLFLLDDATVRERVQEMQALGLCEIDPPDRTLSARTIVIPTDTLLARFDEHLLALAARVRTAAQAVDPTIRPRVKLTLDPPIRQAILAAVERCDQAWIAALEAVFDQLNLSPARRLDARRHLLSVSHRMLMLMALEYAAGISPHADEGEGLLADHMAALLLRLARQNFQTTRDHIGYLMQLGLLERRAGRALRIGLAAPVIAVFAPEFDRLAASLPALVGAFDSVEDVEATLTIRQKPALVVAKVPLVLVVSRRRSNPRGADRHRAAAGRAGGQQRCRAAIRRGFAHALPPGARRRGADGDRPAVHQRHLPGRPARDRANSGAAGRRAADRAVYPGLPARGDQRTQHRGDA